LNGREDGRRIQGGSGICSGMMSLSGVFRYVTI
jgi:hypothetical protein